MHEHAVHTQGTVGTRWPHTLRQCGAGFAQVVACLSCVLVMASGQVWADEGATDTDEDARILAELMDEDHANRQAATRRLLEDEALTQQDLQRLFIQSETLEQRHRLLRVARHHTIRGMIATRY